MRHPALNKTVVIQVRAGQKEQDGEICNRSLYIPAEETMKEKEP